MRFIAVALLAAFPILMAADEPTTVILVRHAEKAAELSQTDPPLTAAGEARAAELARMLRDSGIDAVYVTPFQRTRETARPLVEAVGLEAVELQTGKAFARDTASLIRAKHAGQTVLVVGHSNSTPDLARALGASDVPVIEDAWEFDNIFFVTFREEERPHFVRIRYGAVSAPAGSAE